MIGMRFRFAAVALIAFVMGGLSGALALDFIYPVVPMPAPPTPFPTTTPVPTATPHFCPALQPPCPMPRGAPDLDDPLEEMAVALYAMEMSLKFLEQDLSSTPGEYNQLIVMAISWLNEAHFQIADARMGVFYADAINDRPIPTPAGPDA